MDPTLWSTEYARNRSKCAPPTTVTHRTLTATLGAGIKKRILKHSETTAGSCRGRTESLAVQPCGVYGLHHPAAES